MKGKDIFTSQKTNILSQSLPKFQSQVIFNFLLNLNLILILILTSGSILLRLLLFLLLIC